MDFNQVRYFLALADTLNFTRAAEQCHVSQPALTQSIKRLENELGGQLVARDGRYTELTELGKSLRQHFEQIDRTRHLVKATAKAAVLNEAVELNIGLMCTIGPRVLASMLDRFRSDHPEVSIVLHDVAPTVIPDLLQSGAIDGAFCGRHGQQDSRLRYFGLFEEPLVVALPEGHELSKLDTVPVKELVGYKYIDRLHCEFRQEVGELLQAQNLELEVVFRSQREDWIQSLVRDGMGISCIPKYSLLSTGLDCRPLVDPPLSRSVEFAVAGHAHLPEALELLIQHMQAQEWPTA